ncbi:hypothetical protein ACS0TY_002109 [Phlomoides rotata]
MMTTSTMMFKMHLEQLGFSPQKHGGEWVIWEPPLSEFSFEQLSWIDSSVKDKIKRLLVEMPSESFWQQCLVQFWALEQQQQQQQLYLTTFDQPFAVCGQAPYGYRERCMGYRYRVDEGADDKELGAVGRVYRIKRPESTPDLRLYSNNEFPFRDDADACGLRSYCALPLFDIEETEYLNGVIEFLTYDDYYTMAEIQMFLEAAQLRTTHLNLGGSVKEVDSEIMEMLQLAKTVMPQLQTTNVWIPCHECTNTNNLSCMEISHPMVADLWDSIGSSSSYDMLRYRKACGLHHLQIGEYANVPAITVCRNSSHNSTRDFKVVEFFLQCNSRKDEFYKSHLPLLLRVMEMKLKKYKFAYGGELEVGESSALGYESIKYKHERSKKHNPMMGIMGWSEIYRLSDFTKYLKRADLHYSKPSKERDGWVICEKESSLGSDIIQERIKCLMIKLASPEVFLPYAVGQFWAPKLVGNSCYLEASGQPFGLDGLYKSLAYFRKQCMGHRYYVSENGAAKEDKLGPPGRVFLNGHPETTPDLRLYSPTEFPLREHAVRCRLTSYVALPIFKLNEPKCVGVLELLVFFDNTLFDVASEEIKTANLSSTHVNFKPRLLLGNNGWELASTEIQKAWELFAAIPQLYTVPLPTMTLALVDPLLRKVQHAETGKGIAGMALVSDSKSCFCRNLCEFSIADQPLALNERNARLDVCFAICLQSQHTGDLVYILHFYLNGACRRFEHFKSVLCSLLQIMKQTLKSCKVASGQELGEKLVVEVIEFSQVNEMDFSESEQLEDLPVIFKFVNYHAQKHDSEDKQAQFAPSGVESIAQEEAGQCSTAEPNLKKKDAAEEVQGRKRKTRLNITFQDLKPYFGRKLKDVVKEVGVSRSTLKRICRDNDMIEWPCKENHKNNLSIFVRGSAKESTQQNISNLPVSNMALPQDDPQCSRGPVVEPMVDMVVIKANNLSIIVRGSAKKSTQQNISNLPVSNMALPQDDPQCSRGPVVEPMVDMVVIKANNLSIIVRGSAKKSTQQNISNLPVSDIALPQDDPQSSRGPIVEPKVDMVVIKAKYEDDTIRIELCRSEGLENLLNEVGRRLKLSVESFKLKYMDEDDDEILLACDDDLQHFLKISTAMDKPYYIQVCRKVILPRAIEFIDLLPSWIRKYVVNTANVLGDGHCGFRVVAKQMGFGEEAWGRVRRDLIEELKLHNDLYSKVFIEKNMVNDVMSRLNNFDYFGSPEYHWFMLPEMGHLVASKYNVILITLSNSMCNTFLPFRTVAPAKPKCICIGLLEQEKHFIEVTLHPGHPLPHIIYPWKKYCFENAATWSDFCQKQISMYNQLIGYKPDIDTEEISH